MKIKAIREVYTDEVGNILHIFQTVCDYYQITIEQANSHSRSTTLKKCRQVSHYLSHNLVRKAPFSVIGKIIGNRDHCTVMYSIKEITDKITPINNNGIVVDKELRLDIAKLTLKLQDKVN